MAAGADDFVPKTELTIDLLSAIRQVTQADRSRQRLADTTVHPSPRPGSHRGSLSASGRNAVP